MPTVNVYIDEIEDELLESYQAEHSKISKQDAIKRIIREHLAKKKKVD